MTQGYFINRHFYCMHWNCQWTDLIIISLVLINRWRRDTGWWRRNSFVCSWVTFIKFRQHITVWELQVPNHSSHRTKSSIIVSFSWEEWIEKKEMWNQRQDAKKSAEEWEFSLVVCSFIENHLCSFKTYTHKTNDKT